MPRIPQLHPAGLGLPRLVPLLTPLAGTRWRSPWLGPGLQLRQTQSPLRRNIFYSCLAENSCKNPFNKIKKNRWRIQPSATNRCRRSIMDRAARQRRKRSPLLESDYIQKKNAEISHIVTDMDLIKGQRLRNE
jgi:hypothetical protein